MAMDKESNAYTIIFATIMVVVVGGLLAFLAIPCTLPADNVSVDSSTPVAGTVIVVVVRTPFRSAAG